MNNSINYPKVSCFGIVSTDQQDKDNKDYNISIKEYKDNKDNKDKDWRKRILTLS